MSSAAIWMIPERTAPFALGRSITITPGVPLKLAYRCRFENEACQLAFPVYAIFFLRRLPKLQRES
jgi:hypothetical protein